MISIWSKEKCSHIADMYEKWNTECVHHIYIDFAFVIYDKEAQMYFASRDVVGTRPLYYTIQNNQFYYSDDIAELAIQSKINKEPNIDAMRMLIDHRTIPYDATMYKHIKRLPPGHFVIVDKDGNPKIERYWKPEEIKIDENINEEEAKECFLELFEQVIKERIEDISTTSFDLSGGLDSSSIVSMVKQKYPQEKLHTVSMSFETLQQCDEGEYTDTMKEKYDIDTHKVRVDNLDYKNKYSLEHKYTLDSHWPMLVTHTMLFATAERLNEMGIKRVLTGQGGDQVMAGNAYSIYDYLKHFQWVKAYRELKAVNSPMRMLKKYIVLPLLSDNQKKSIKFILQKLGYKKLNADEAKVIPEKTFQELSSLYCKDGLSFCNDVNGVLSSHQSLIMDISAYHVIKKHYGIRYYHPFYDRRLIEFMLSLPPRFKYCEGVTKVLLRQAMKGILPEKIRQRKDKAEFTAVLKQQIDAIDLDELLKDTHLAKLGLIVQSEVDKLKEDYQSGKMKTVVHFWKIINMEYWYRYNFVDQKETVKY